MSQTATGAHPKFSNFDISIPRWNELSAGTQTKVVAQAGLENLCFFNKHILKYPDICETVHGEWEEFLKSGEKKKKLLLVPRGHLKTTFVTVGGSLQDIIRDNNTRILFANAIGDNAQSFLFEIKEHIKSNKELHTYYPETATWEKSSSKWSEKHITIPRTRQSKEPTIETSGVGGSLVSQHYDKIILDDLVNVENSATRIQADKVIDYYKQCLSLLEPEGELIVIGTRYTYYELYQYIIDELKNDFDIFIRTCYKQWKTKTVPYFPKKFTIDSLAEIKRGQGSYVFSCQYKNEPVDDESAVFKKSWILNYERSPEPLYKVTTVDPAISKEKHGNYSAIVTTGVSEFGKKYILQIKRGKWNPFELIDQIFDTYSDFKSNVVGVESVSYQKSLRFYLEDEMKRRDIYLPLDEINPDTRITKEMKIKGLQPFYERGEIFQKKEMVDLEEELIKFPVCATDDIIDALSNQIKFWQLPDIVAKTEHEPATHDEMVKKEFKEREREANKTPADETLGDDY